MSIVTHFKRWVSILSPAYAAALALIIIQVSIGLLYKAAQTNGKYGFSASSSVTISEFCKFLLSTFFFLGEWRKRRHTAVAQDEAEAAAEEEAHELKERDSESRSSEDDDGESSTTLRLSQEDYAGDLPPWMGGQSKGMVMDFVIAVKDEVATDVRYGFAHLALFYVVMNNMIFILFRLADPGTIQLIKSGTTLITAVVMIITLGTKMAGNQWIAICMQVCGIVITQYNPVGGATYPVFTYGMLLFHTTMSAVSSVFNQILCKSEGSLHAMNMTLYGAGAIINLALHLMVRILNTEEPGFFTGYGNFGAIMVIVSNVFIGLAMTAVYKYADALIKCFATAISTAILLYLSPLYFDVDFSFLVIPGTVIVFLATYLYMFSSPPKPAAPATQPVLKEVEEPVENKSFIKRIYHAFSPKGPFRAVGLATTTTAAFILLAALTAYRIQLNQETSATPVATTVPDPVTSVSNSTVINGTETEFALEPLIIPIPEIIASPKATIFESPFKNVVASIRINHDLPERIPTLREGYEPFFHTVHISMPHGNEDPTQTNYTRDFWNNGEMPYPPVVDLVQFLVEDPGSADIEGLIWYHFDSWIEPLSFGGMDFEKLWVLDGSDPQFWCMTDPKMMDWWSWISWGKQDAVRDASREIKQKHPKYKLNPEEFCSGWADMYYIPRKYFEDFVTLGKIYGKHNAYHEIAIPTLFHIIDQTYRKHPSLSIIYKWADCWGNCCKDNPRKFDVLRKRCGHKLNYLDPNVTNVFYDRLAENAMLLGTPLPEDGEEPGDENPEIQYDVEKGAVKI